MCTLKFAALDELDNHSRCSHVVQFLQCEGCQFKTKNEKDFNIHLETLQKCRKCDERYHNEDSLKTHIENQHKEESLKCDACEFTTVHQETLGKHIVDFHSQPMNVDHNSQSEHQNSVQCDQCNETFFINEDLEKHRNASHAVNNKKILVQQEYINQVLAENALLKTEVAN